MAKGKSESEKPAIAFDKRVVERNIQRGLVTRSEVEAHLEQLPDLTAASDNIADRVYGNEQ